MRAPPPARARGHPGALQPARNAGFVFYVLPRAFVIHCPHLPSVSRQNWQLFRDKKDELFRSFIREHL